MRPRKGNLSTAHRWMLAGLFLLPLAAAAGKWAAMPTSEFLQQAISLADLPPPMQERLQYVLFVPAGAVLVVFCRLTLGIRLLGPFRSILLAVAFQITGVLAGILFLLAVIATITCIRPTLRKMRLPYFGRVSVMLGVVSIIIIAITFLGNWTGTDWLCGVAYFPIVVLCLVGEGFARTLAKEGVVSALWRGATTVAVAVLLAWLSEVPTLRQLWINYPELLVVEIGVIIVISEFFDLRLLHWVNPEIEEDAEDVSETDACETAGLGA